MYRYFSVISSNKKDSGTLPKPTDDEEEDPEIEIRDSNSSNGSALNLSDDHNHNDDDEEGSLSKKIYFQKAREAWTKDPLLKEWILLKHNTVECKYCKTIFNKPKYSNLKDHVKTNKHVAAAEPFSTARQNNIQFMAKTTLTASHEAEARNSLYIAKHTSILSVDHLTQV